MVVLSYADGYGGFGRAITNAMGSFESGRSESLRLFGAFSEDRKMGAIVLAEAGTESIVLALSATAILRGTLIDEETGQPAANREIGASIRAVNRGSTTRIFRQSDTTDGRFEIAGVVPGYLYHLNVWVERDDERDNKGPRRALVGVYEVEPTRAETIELGEFRLPISGRTPK